MSKRRFCFQPQNAGIYVWKLPKLQARRLRAKPFFSAFSCAIRIFCSILIGIYKWKLRKLRKRLARLFRTKAFFAHFHVRSAFL